MMADYRRRPQEVTCCDKCCRWVQVKLLIIINLVDFVASGSLMFFGIYLKKNNLAPEYVYVPVLSIGIYALTTCLLSLWGSCCWKSCWGCCLYPVSAILGLVLGLAEIAGGGVLLGYREKYSSWLDDNQEQYNISNKQLDELKHGITAVAIGLFLLAFMEMVRFCASRGFKRGRRQDDDTRAMLEEYETLEADDRRQVRASERSQKYNQLRQHYRDKYGPVNGGGRRDEY